MTAGPFVPFAVPRGSAGAVQNTRSTSPVRTNAVTGTSMLLLLPLLPLLVLLALLPLLLPLLVPLLESLESLDSSPKGVKRQSMVRLGLRATPWSETFVPPCAGPAVGVTARMTGSCTL